MSKIGDVFGLIFLCLLLIWGAGLVFTTDKCTKVHRSAWPVTFTMGLVEDVSANWTTTDTKLSLLRYKAKGAVAMQNIYEKTVYGDKDKCNK